MNTKEYIRRQLGAKNWLISDLSYERPRSGFKSVDGGWLLLIKTEYENGEDGDQLLGAIPFDQKINGTIDSTGVIMAMTAPDLKKLVDKIPKRNSEYVACDYCAERFKNETDLDAHLFNNKHCR